MSCEKCYYSRWENLPLNGGTILKCKFSGNVEPWDYCGYDTTGYTKGIRKNKKICLHCKYCHEMTHSTDLSLWMRTFKCFRPTGIRHDKKRVKPTDKACKFYEE